MILGEENRLVGVGELFLVYSGRSHSLRRLWLRLPHVLDLNSILIAR